MRIVERGTIDNADSAFAQTAVLEDGSLLSAFSDAGGQFATGGTSLSRSRDGRTWSPRETLLGAVAHPRTTNFLKASASTRTRTVFAYGARQQQPESVVFDDRRYDAVLCRSIDGGSTWSSPATVPFPTHALEISHGVLALRSGRLLAPAATIEEGRLGERVLVAISDDDGLTWPRHATALVDPDGELGFLEQKLTQLNDGRILATAWAVSLADASDRSNHFAISDDEGETWSAPHSMEIFGQTLSAVQLPDERFLLAYNRRYGEQGVVLALAQLNGLTWKVEQEILGYDPDIRRLSRTGESLAEEMLDFQFGFPILLLRDRESALLTYWSVEDGSCGVRWASIRF
ncbi:sialidase family protein [Microbacterium sp. LWO12-1.2]|uniref:sialidase family protein n=1 Tax=Microbacterium sp. LWO12-1.2 TaxID=3135261 RepID=UPI00343F1A04